MALYLSKVTFWGTRVLGHRHTSVFGGYNSTQNSNELTHRTHKGLGWTLPVSLGIGWDGQGGVSRRMCPLFLRHSLGTFAWAGTQLDTRGCCAPVEEPHIPIAPPFDRTRQGEASTAGNKQTICVPGSLHFGAKRRSPTSSCVKEELADPINSLIGLIQREF